MKIFQPIVTGSLSTSGSVFFPSLVTSSTAVSNVVMFGANGQLFITASSAIGGGGGSTNTKAGSGSAASFGGTPRTASITFGSAFSDNLYTVAITGEDARSWTIQSKSTTGFTINSNSSVALTGPVYWVATTFN
jgi:hypothetical protein